MRGGGNSRSTYPFLHNTIGKITMTTNDDRQIKIAMNANPFNLASKHATYSKVEYVYVLCMVQINNGIPLELNSNSNRKTNYKILHYHLTNHQYIIVTRLHSNSLQHTLYISLS